MRVQTSFNMDLDITKQFSDFCWKNKLTKSRCIEILVIELIKSEGKNFPTDYNGKHSNSIVASEDAQ